MTSYLVGLWVGAGVKMETIKIEAHDPEDALIQASLKIGVCIPVDEADEDVVNAPDLYMYLDRSEYGKENAYLLIESAFIREI